MKKILITALPVLIASCAAHNEQPKMIGMANPASVYCKKIGGKLEIVKEPAGEVGYCTLPGGERIEEWTLYRRDNK
ncbi:MULTISPECIES: DUF333 domain-containing protein [Erwiniaceae]|uniref:putative hemolysin n=1 Tax=Erwiniaceae TaxID=1903409 RepID=UPI00190BBFFC|nr:MULTISPECIES: DUF333 domain-containing protein [Erwiniaceae]MBK0000320.1 DUF333 domain-containing protein [Erwinia sp. S38]MBM7346088.1 putative hemolysin [Pantoea coffeiphila]